MKTSNFNYTLPQELIAQTPIEARDQSRLMVLNRNSNSIKHQRFFEVIHYLQAGDVLVFNNSRVIKARLKARKVDTGGKLEVFLLHRLSPNVWEALVRSNKRINMGAKIEIVDDSAVGSQQNRSVQAEVVGFGEGGIRVIAFSDDTVLPQLGEVPLPPYIRKPLANPERYQTVYAKVPGSIAAPTAGLHFTPELINRIKEKGIHCLFVTLHVGLDTFRPVREDDPRKHPIHREYGVLGNGTADEISRAKAEGRRVICVGTTTARLIEAAAQPGSSVHLHPFEGWINLFILPGYQFKIVDALITNFHLPKSTLLMLVMALAGKDLINRAYQEAIAQKYRFYSFGDAMLIL